MIWRVDQGGALRTAGPRRFTGTLARPGVLRYGRRRELVTAAALRSSADQLIGLPVTLTHPTDPYGEVVPVSAANREAVTVGRVVRATTNADGSTEVELEVTHPDALKAVASGVRELSPGYTPTLGAGGADPQFGEFDLTQTGRSYNHVSIVPSGRCGSACSLHVDSIGTWEPPRSCTCRSDAAPRRPTANQLSLARAAEARARTLGLPAPVATRTDATPERPARRLTANEMDALRIAAARADADEQHRKAAAEALARAQGRPLPPAEAPVARSGRRPTANEEHAARVAAARAAAEGTGGTGGSGR